MLQKCAIPLHKTLLIYSNLGSVIFWTHFCFRGRISTVSNIRRDICTRNPTQLTFAMYIAWICFRATIQIVSPHQIPRAGTFCFVTIQVWRKIQFFHIHGINHRLQSNPRAQDKKLTRQRRHSKIRSKTLPLLKWPFAHLLGATWKYLETLEFEFSYRADAISIRKTHGMDGWSYGS